MSTSCRLFSRHIFDMPAVMLRSTLVLLMVSLSFVSISSHQANAAAGFGAGTFGQSAAPVETNSSFNNPVAFWSTIEPTEGNFDWSSLEDALDAADGEGKTSIVRLVANWSSFAQSLPAWVIAAGAETYSQGSMDAPVPWDAVYQAKLAATIAEFGDQYDGDPRIEFIQIIVGGSFGEQFFPSALTGHPDYSISLHKQTVDWHYDAFQAAFSATPLAMMINSLGINENGLPYKVGTAAADGVYLEVNTPLQFSVVWDAFREHDDETKVVIEAESASADPATFESQMETLFGGGSGDPFAIDYLIFHGTNHFGNPTINSYIGNTVLPALRQSPSADVVAIQVAGGVVTVDGAVTESAWNHGGGALPYELSRVIIGTSDNTTHYSILWNATHLYVGVRVLDAALESDSGNVHDDDSIDLYIDGDHDHGASYDSHDNFYQKGWNDGTVVAKDGNTSGVLHDWRNITGGYEIELAILWANLSVSPGADDVIGFDIAGNDDDNGGQRDCQAMAFGTVDNWTDTSAFGDLLLQG